MDKAGKSARARVKKQLATIGYCAVCYHSFYLEVLITLRPTKDSGERSMIALADRRVTMCKEHADEAIKAGTHERVNVV